MTNERHHVRPSFAEAVALAIVLTFQWSVVRTLQNGAFVDEATYIVAGRLLRSGAAAAGTFASYFSGAPVLYPPLAAWADALGGLAGARLASLVCVWLATLGVFAATRRLFADGVAGVAAATLFALAAPTMFLARLATYDAPSLALLAGALACAAFVGGANVSGRRVALGALTGALLALAVATKYAALLYAPAIVLVAALGPGDDAAPRTRAAPLAALATVAALVVALVASASDARAILHGFATTTLTRTAPSGGDTAAILAFAARLGGVVIGLAVPALLLVRGRARWIAGVLFVTALLAPLNHARLHEFVSLHKHVAFGTLFAAPLAGLTVARVVTWARRAIERGRGVLAVSVLVAAALAALRLVIGPAQEEASRLYVYWPASTPRVYAALRPMVGNRSARFLDEEPDLGAYYTAGRTTYGQWTHPYFFRYAPAGAPPLTGRAAYVQAVRDGYFDAVVLRYGPQRAWAHAIEDELLAAQPRYRLAARIPFTVADGDGAYDVWVRADAPGAALVR